MQTNNMYTDKIRDLGNKLIHDFITDGRIFNHGLNGPYDDEETDVRYMAHLIVIAAVEYLKFGNIDYKKVVANIGDSLLKMKQSNGLYKMRNKPGKDECNGTIGHAWLVEGFLYAYKSTREMKYLEESERICLMHSFNNDLGLWGRPLMGCNDKSIDYTFNHQLWYAATLAELLQLKDNEYLRKQLDIFIKRLPQNFSVNKDGRVRHAIYSRIAIKEKLKQNVLRLRDIINEKMSRPSLRYKEVGYHCFNIMAFARLYNLLPECVFFKSNKFIKALIFMSREDYIKELESDNLKMDASSHGSTLTGKETSINIYGYPYNVPGLEVFYCHSIFSKKINEIIVKRMAEKQFELTWDYNTGRFGKLCHDMVSVNYRIYEYYRYLEISK